MIETKARINRLRQPWTGVLSSFKGINCSCTCIFIFFFICLPLISDSEDGCDLAFCAWAKDTLSSQTNKVCIVNRLDISCNLMFKWQEQYKMSEGSNLCPGLDLAMTFYDYCKHCKTFVSCGILVKLTALVHHGRVLWPVPIL